MELPRDQHGTLREIDRRTFLRLGVAATGVALASPLLAACGSSPASPASSGTTAGLKTVSVRFNWTIKGEFTPFFVAREKGYYKQAGLDVQLLEGKSGTQAAQVVGTGKDEFGYIPSVQVIEGINKGIPLKTVATVGRYTGMCWASWPNVPLTGATSLYGHKVSISTSSTFFQVWPGFQKHFHIDPSKITVVHPDPSARDGLFLRHDLDIMADIFYANDYVVLQSKTPVKLNLLRMSELNFDPLGYLLVANESIIKSDPQTVKNLVQATLKGLKFTLDHTAEAAAIMTKLYGSRLGKKVIDGQVHNMPALIIQPNLGKGTDQMWNESLQLLYESGVISTKKPPSTYYTNAFLT